MNNVFKNNLAKSILEFPFLPETYGESAVPRQGRY